jgi:hypothetical protein
MLIDVDCKYWPLDNHDDNEVPTSEAASGLSAAMSAARALQL